MYLTHNTPSGLTRFYIVWYIMMTIVLNFVIYLNAFMIVIGPL